MSEKPIQDIAWLEKMGTGKSSTISRLAGNAIKQSNKLADRRDHEDKGRQIIRGSDKR